MDKSVVYGLAVATGATAGAVLGAGIGVFIGTAVLILLLLLSGPSVPVLLKDPKVKYPCKLLEVEKVSHDVRRMRFELPPDHSLGLAIGKHIYLTAQVDGKMVIRPYTPITCNSDIGFFDLMLKIYMKGTHPRFPDGGKMTQHLDAMAVGDTIDVRGPTGHIVYRGDGTFDLEETKGASKGKVKETRNAKTLGMIAGGTGITPMLQVIRAVLRDPTDKTKIQLLFANQTKEDILVRKEIEECAKDDRFDFWYTVDKPPADWSYSSGFISEEMVRDHLPAPGADVQVLMCGPPIMVEKACKPNLEKVGYSESNFIVY